MTTAAQTQPGPLDLLARHPVALAALGVLVSALIAVVMASTPPPQTEVRLLQAMLPHHAQAVVLTRRIRTRTQDPALRQLALTIEQVQQAEIQQMRALLMAWGQPITQQALSVEHAEAMGMAPPEQVMHLSTLPVLEAERLFLRLMIRHHQGAVAMVAPVQARNGPAEAVGLARTMHAAQTREIKQLTRLLAARGAQPWPALSPAATAGPHQH